MLLKEICTPDVVYCAPQTTALAAARLMRQKHVGDVVVVEDEDGDQLPIGIVTDRDIVVEVLGKELDPAKACVRDIMRTPVVVGRTSENISQAIERMKMHGVRRIPVIDEYGKLAGILSLDDLVRRLASEAAALAEVLERGKDREHRTRR
jgi:CBS domain-containing protein